MARDGRVDTRVCAEDRTGEQAESKRKAPGRISTYMSQTQGGSRNPGDMAIQR